VGAAAPPGMAERVKGVVRQWGRNEELKIGVIARGFPYWVLCAASFKGRVTWIAAPAGARARWERAVGGEADWCPSPGETEEDWREGKAGTDVVLFEDQEPRAGHPVWSLPGLGAVAWSSKGGKGRAPPGWELVRWALSHQRLGGVTTGTDVVWIGFKGEGRRVPPREVGVQAALEEALDKTVTGVPTCRPPGPGLRRLADWKDRGERWVVPCFRSPTQWVRRRLEPKEIAQLMDWPISVARRLRPDDLQEAVDGTRVPFKVRNYVGEYLARELGSTGAPVVASTPALEASGNAPPAVGQLSDLESPGEEADRMAKATKADDAAVPEEFWQGRAS